MEEQLGQQTILRSSQQDASSADESRSLADSVETQSWQQAEQAMIERSSKKRPSDEVRRFFDFRALVPQRENTLITRRYILGKHEVGAGSYGKVFVGEDKEVAGRKVAVKKFVLQNPNARSSFEKEVGLMKELDHPNICKILETYESGRNVWVVMELCAGGEVFDRIMETGTLEEPQTARIVKQVCRALKYAHSRGIAHRDLKPENVCFCDADRSNDHVKVIDWGVGFHFNTSGMSSAVGSCAYAAPEVLQADEVSAYSAACDLWSLGVLTYVMLCGKPPFWGALQVQLRKMKREQYPLQDVFWQSKSDEAKDFIRRLLKVDPAQRLTIDDALAHTWLADAAGDSGSGASGARGQITQQVLSNCRKFGRFDNIFSMCAASVAKQLDHRTLQDVQKVFTEMDTNGDGVLELREVVVGFEEMFGKGSKEARGVEELFTRLDLDGSGKIDYTEFCAAGLGVYERAAGSTANDELSLRAAFKTFDINDDNGRITRDELQRVLASAGVMQSWSEEACAQMTEEIFERYDDDKDGSIDFEEFLRLMRDPRYRRSGSGNSLEDILEGRGLAASSLDGNVLSSSSSIAGPAGSAVSSNSVGALGDADMPQASSGKVGAMSSSRSGGNPPTLLERRPMLRSLGSPWKESGRSKRMFDKVSGMLSSKKHESQKVPLVPADEGSAGLAAVQMAPAARAGTITMSL